MEYLGGDKYGANTISFTITEVWSCWYMVWTFVPNNEQTEMRQVEQTLEQ